MTIAALMLSGLSSYERAKAACETWGRDFAALQIHSFSPSPDEEFNALIKRVGLREGPRSCFEKRLNGLVEAHDMIRTDWYLCASDDCFVWKENLEWCLDCWEKYLPPGDLKWNPKRPMLVGGHTNKLRIADGTIVTYPSGGAGYVLNRAALSLVVGNLGRLRAVWAVKSNNDDIEDAFMGWACQELKIPYLETPGFYGCNPLKGGCERGCVMIERPISIHYCTGEQMREIRQAVKLAAA